MAKALIVAQRHSSGRMLQRGAFTQKKKFWESLVDRIGMEKITHYQLFNDIDQSTIEANYPRLCKFIASYGRVTILDEEGVPQFLVVETTQNEWREWDLDDEGEPVPNPVKK